MPTNIQFMYEDKQPQWSEKNLYLEVRDSNVYHVLIDSDSRTFCGRRVFGASRTLTALAPTTRRLCLTCMRSWKWILCERAV